MHKPRMTVLTGAGISAESGLKTFRDAGGLWEGYRVEDVASPEGWRRDMKMVLDFYNERRRNARQAVPNRAHQILAELETVYDVTVITQNVDDLHERAGSSRIVHLHGELFKCRSTGRPDLIYTLQGTELNPGDLCEKGYQLRPHIVWFGEEVPEMETAMQYVTQTDILVVIGTSLAVYPAASLLWYVSPGVPVYYVDPGTPDFQFGNQVVHIREKATTGMEKLKKMLITTA